MMQTLEELFFCFPQGYRGSMIAAAATKRWLLAEKDPEQRLYLLEQLNRLADNQTFTPRMLAAIQAMNSLEDQMFTAAMTVTRGADQFKVGFSIIEDWDTFRHFALANPSYAEAMRVGERERQEHAQSYRPQELTA